MPFDLETKCSSRIQPISYNIVKRIILHNFIADLRFFFPHFIFSFFMYGRLGRDLMSNTAQAPPAKSCSLMISRTLKFTKKQPSHSEITQVKEATERGQEDAPNCTTERGAWYTYQYFHVHVYFVCYFFAWISNLSRLLIPPWPHQRQGYARLWLYFSSELVNQQR